MINFFKRILGLKEGTPTVHDASSNGCPDLASASGPAGLQDLATRGPNGKGGCMEATAQAGAASGVDPTQAPRQVDFSADPHLAEVPLNLVPTGDHLRDKLIREKLRIRKDPT